MIIKPKIRGFICTTAHPVGCAQNVKEQIQYVKDNTPAQKGAKNVLILGDGLHAVHPMAGQGFNLVLRDIKKLSDLMSKTLKLGLSLKNSFLLKEFYQARKPENTILGMGIDLTNIFFKNNKYLTPIKRKILNNIKRFKFIRKLSQAISDKGFVI